MNKYFSLLLASVPLILTSCATLRPPVVFQNTDNAALVIASLDTKTSQMVKPAASARAGNDQILTKASEFPQRQTAVVMLENYSEPRMGAQFRNRTTPLFICLRGLGYEHIVFLQGQNVNDPNGLITLAEYY